MGHKAVVLKARGELIAAILSGSWRTSKPELNLSAADLEEITPLLYASGAAALGWRQICETDLSITQSGQVLRQGYRLQALQVAMREEKIVLVHQLLQAANIEAILVKGWALAGFYPEVSLRPLGDVDLVVRPADYQAARDLLASPAARGCWTDLHSGIAELGDRSLVELFSRSEVVSFRGTPIRVLSLADHLALLAIHLLKHGAWRPLWLCDIAAVVESLPEGFDWGACLGSDSRRSSWISASIGLANQLLGARLDRVPLPARTKQMPAWLPDAVLKQWGNLFPSDHLPVQARPLMTIALSSPRTVLKQALERWPDSITATFNMRGRINNFPRLPYQIGEFSLRAGRYLIGQMRRTAART